MNKPGKSSGGADRKRPNSSKSKPPMAKRSQKPKKASDKPAAKAAEKAKAEPKYSDVTGKLIRVRKRNQAPKRQKEKDEIRLNKYIANSGMCSRRDADIYIQSGNVKVNGTPVIEMGYLVKLTDTVVFDGKTIIPEKKVYILLNKPKNFTTAEDEGQEHRNVFELIKGATNYKIAPIGRMDKNTTGLLLFTNDTDMMRKFTGPNQKSAKIYHVSLDKNLKFEDFEKIENGLIIDEHKVKVQEISYVENEPKTEIGVQLKTANIKVVRNIFEHLSYNVLRIDRVVLAGLTKKNLPRGHWRLLTEQEIINLNNL